MTFILHLRQILPQYSREIGGVAAFLVTPFTTGLSHLAEAIATGPLLDLSCAKGEASCAKC